MLTLPSVDHARGEVGRIVFPVDSDENLNISQTGGVLLVDTSGGDVTLVLPPLDEAEGKTMYILLVCGANMLEVEAFPGDDIEGYDVAWTSTQWTMGVFQATSSRWQFQYTAGTWNMLSTTTTT